MDDQRRVPEPEQEHAVGEAPADAAVIERERRQPQPDDRKDHRDEASREHGHGRSATSPSEIPKRGWKDILMRVYRGISDDRILANAGAVTFFALLALFPGIGALVSIYGLFSDAGTIGKQLDTLSLILPGGAIEVIGGELTRLTSQPAAKLGFGFVFGLLVALWSANGGIKALFDALNTVYEENEKRSFIRLNALSLTFTAGMILFLVVAIASIVALPAILEYLPGFVGTVLNIARWPVLAVLVAVALSCIYRYGPSRDTPKWRWITWGSGFAAVAWLITSAVFSFYAANFGTFNKTYGSLGAIMGFMLWIWISGIVILLGAKLNAEMEHQTARDSTEGQPERLGQRGAKMADTVGPAQGS
jgi:membrane protein